MDYLTIYLYIALTLWLLTFCYMFLLIIEFIEVKKLVKALYMDMLLGREISNLRAYPTQKGLEEVNKMENKEVVVDKKVTTELKVDIAYCVKCRKNVEVKDSSITTKTGIRGMRTFLSGNCKNCNTRVTRILKNPEVKNAN